MENELSDEQLVKPARNGDDKALKAKVKNLKNVIPANDKMYPKICQASRPFYLT